MLLLQCFHTYVFFDFLVYKKPMVCVVLLTYADSMVNSYPDTCNAGNNEKLKILNMGQHILDSLDTPQQLYQVCQCVCVSAACAHWCAAPIAPIGPCSYESKHHDCELKHANHTLLTAGCSHAVHLSSIMTLPLCLSDIYVIAAVHSWAGESDHALPSADTLHRAGSW